ncbi:hypothetical protein JCM8547_001738 [Rhodosporidiobolus lusitaniae]
MLKGFFGSVSGPQDQTTPKASADTRNPFDFIKNSSASATSPAPPSAAASTSAAGGSRTPTLKPSPSYSGSLGASPGQGFFAANGASTEPSTPGASTPVTPGGVRSQPTTALWSRLNSNWY